MKIYIIDRNRLLREGLKKLAESQGLTVCGESSSVPQTAVDHASAAAQIFVLSLGDDAEAGFESLRALKTAYPGCPILLLSRTTDRSVVRGCLLAGADGYLVKWASPREFVRALESVSQGNSYLHPEVVPHILKDLRQRGNEATVGPLTGRELEVLRLVSDGCTNSEIAARLFVSVSTVKNHVRSLFTRFSATDRTRLVVEAMKMGLLTSSSAKRDEN